MNFWNIPVRRVLLSPFCPGGKPTVWKTEELAQNYTASKWFEIGIQLFGFLPGSLSIAPTRLPQRSPCIHFIGSQVNKSCKHQLWYFHTYVTLTRKLSHSKEQWLSVISDNLKKIEILPDHVKFNSTNLHTQQFSIYLPYLLLEILLFAEQTKSPFTRW